HRGRSPTARRSAPASTSRRPNSIGRRTKHPGADVSGDGDNNSGRPVTAARDGALAKGVTINGLVILTETPSLFYSNHTDPPGGLANYYRHNVIGGDGAFVVIAKNFNAFGNAIIKKLIGEIARAEPPQRSLLFGAAH